MHVAHVNYVSFTAETYKLHLQLRNSIRVLHICDCLGDLKI